MVMPPTPRSCLWRTGHCPGCCVSSTLGLSLVHELGRQGVPTVDGPIRLVARELRVCFEMETPNAGPRRHHEVGASGQVGCAVGCVLSYGPIGCVPLTARTAALPACRIDRTSPGSALQCGGSRRMVHTCLGRELASVGRSDHGGLQRIPHTVNQIAIRPLKHTLLL